MCTDERIGSGRSQSHKLPRLLHNLTVGHAKSCTQSSESLSSAQSAEEISSDYLSFTWRVSAKKPEVEACEGLEIEKLKAAVISWPGDLETGTFAVRKVLELVTAAKHGCLVVMAPREYMDASNFQSYCSHVDKGYMTERLGKHKIWDSSFHDDFMEFVKHTDTDRWPLDYRDEEARGQPKDGAVILDSTGQLVKAATRVTGLPLPAFAWPSHGTRHMTALQIASFLKSCVVAVRSDGGAVHILAENSQDASHVDCWCVAEGTSAEPLINLSSAESVSSTQASEPSSKFLSWPRPQLLPRLANDVRQVAKEFEADVISWPGEANSAVLEMLELVIAATHGCLVVMAPREYLDASNFQSHCSHVDKGYMTERLGKHKIWDSSFHDDFMEFVEHTGTDRWPFNHRDENARGQPKDGAIILDSHGRLVKAATRIAGLPLPAFAWPSHGTRHMAALQIASFLKSCVVAVRSDSGAVHILAKRHGDADVDCWLVEPKASSSFHLITSILRSLCR